MTVMNVILTVLVHEDETGGYWGEVLEFPGCISQGESLDEMDSNIREAIEAVLDVKLEDGEDIASISRAPASTVEPGVRKWEIFGALACSRFNLA